MLVAVLADRRVGAGECVRIVLLLTLLLFVPEQCLGSNKKRSPLYRAFKELQETDSACCKKLTLKQSCPFKI